MGMGAGSCMAAGTAIHSGVEMATVRGLVTVSVAVAGTGSGTATAGEEGAEIAR